MALRMSSYPHVHVLMKKSVNARYSLQEGVAGDPGEEPRLGAEATCMEDCAFRAVDQEPALEG